MFPLLWLLYLVLINAILAAFTYVLFFRKNTLHDSTSAQEKITYLKRHVPLSCAKGWHLKMVDSGLRVWEKQMGSNHPAWIPGIIYACSGIIPASQQEVINILKQPGLLVEWDPRVKAITKVTMATNRDVISLSFNCTGIIARFLHRVRSSLGGEIHAIYTRYWDTDCKPNSEAWFVSSCCEQVVPAEGALWSCFLVSSIENGDDQQKQSLITLIVAPVSSVFTSVQQLTVARLTGLQDFFTHYRVEVSSATSAKCTFMPSSETENHVSDLMASSPMTLSGGQESERRTMKISKIMETDLMDSSQLPEFFCSENRENLVQRLCKVYEATEGTDGWVSVGNMKGVDIMKRPAQSGERPWDTFKGSSVVNAPALYTMAYIHSFAHRCEWDENFVKGDDILVFDPLLKVTLTEFKPVWPASGRDFCNVAVTVEMSDGLFCQAYEAVEVDNCPEQKGLVRAEIIIGGFVIKELSSDPPKCHISYITRVDLKGNLPARLVNRVTLSQPKSLAVIREKVEALYQAEANSDDISPVKQKSDELWAAMVKAKVARFPGAEKATDGEEKESMLEWSVIDKHGENESSASSSDTLNQLQISNRSSSGEMFPISAENMKLPFVDRHLVDYKTLGSQAASNLLGEVLLASKVEISMSEEFSLLGSKQGDWRYHSVEKDVVILSKVSQGEKIHSFLGKGMIKVKPPAVWQAVRNPMTRYMYDRMLKKAKIVRQIDDQTKISYLHHETTQCFVKQSRDFVVLVAERVEPERYIVSGVSVDLPELPPTKNIIRGKIHSSGWIIEPVLQNGQLYSMVSYLSQVDFGGAIPTSILNHIARRQPLCIAYLRDYLLKFEDKKSNV